MDFPDLEDLEDDDLDECEKNQLYIDNLTNKYDMSKIETWSELQVDIKTRKDAINYFERVCALLGHFKFVLEEPISFKVLPISGGKAHAVLMGGDWQLFGFREMLTRNQSGIRKTPCIPHMLNGEHLEKIIKVINVLGEDNDPGGKKEKEIEESITKELEEAKKKNMEMRKSNLDTLARLDKKEYENYKLREEIQEIIKIRDTTKKDLEHFIRRKGEIIAKMKKMETFKGVDLEEETDEETHKRIVGLIGSLEEYLQIVGEYTIADYKKHIGEEFDPLCGLLFKINQKGIKMSHVKERLAAMLHRNYDMNTDEIVEEILETDDKVRILLKRLKSKVKEEGMFYQKIGGEEITLGITKNVLVDLEEKKRIIEENEGLISSLRKKVEELRKGFTKSKERDFRDWYKEGAESNIINMASYLKNKAYRIPVIQKLFGKSEYKQGMKYCGIRINTWEFDYLEKKSLSSVLNKKPEDLVNIDEIGYSIKCLNALMKIKDVRRAILWARNYYAKKLGREQASRSKWCDQRVQNTRFYNTYVFVEGVTLEDFLEMSDGNRTTRFLKQYKQLDREINACYMTRFYSRKETKKSYDSHRHQKILKSLASLVYQQETIALRRDVVKVTNKRNPLVAARKLRNLVNEKFSKTLSTQSRNELIRELYNEIPSITYDKSGSRYNPRYHDYTMNVLEKKAVKKETEEILRQTYYDELENTMFEDKGKGKEEGPETDDLSDLTDYNYYDSDEQYYDDYDEY